MLRATKNNLLQFKNSLMKNWDMDEITLQKFFNFLPELEHTERPLIMMEDMYIIKLLIEGSSIKPIQHNGHHYFHIVQADPTVPTLFYDIIQREFYLATWADINNTHNTLQA